MIFICKLLILTQSFLFIGVMQVLYAKVLQDFVQKWNEKMSYFRTNDSYIWTGFLSLFS